jgi:Ran GTPase-activating protein (RanGAP) involved in mRNA processing and transport
MIYKTEILRELMPALCESTSLVSIDLAANGLGEDHCGMVARIIQEHQERKDERRWLQSLRKIDDNKPVRLNTLKQLVLSFNELRGSNIKMLSSVIRNDNYLRSLDLRGNLIESEWVAELYSAF